MTAFTFPVAWRVQLADFPHENPQLCGQNVVVTAGTAMHAFARGDGERVWSVAREGAIAPVVAVDGGCVAATSEPDGMRVERFDDHGRVVWELPGRWNLCPQGLVGAKDRVLLAGRRRDAMSDPRLWELSAVDGSVIRSVTGSARAGAIAIEGGWAWVDDLDSVARVRMLDASGDRVVSTGNVTALAATGEWLFADGADVVSGYQRGALAWERPAGKTSHVVADPRGIVCGHRDGDGLWICAYALDGSPQWKTGPFPDGYPTITFWNDLVIASGLYLGEGDAVAILHRQDGRVIAIESGGWTTGAGSIAVDGDAAFVTGGEQVTRRERRSWTRIEDAWDADYTTAVAAQLVADGDVALPDTSNLPVLRDALAATRAAGRTTYDRFADAVAWMFSDADWPLWGLDLPADRPERRIEMINFDSEHDGPLWDERGRIASYPQLRLLSLRSNRLAGDLAIDLTALPRLEYLSLSENALTRVPSEVRACRALIHLNLRDNRLASIDPAELPSTLRWLDVGQNRLPEEAVRRLRAALPDCHIESYAQR